MMTNSNNYELDYHSVYKLLKNGNNWNSNSYGDYDDYSSPFFDKDKLRVIKDLILQQQLNKAAAKNQPAETTTKQFDELDAHELRQIAADLTGKQADLAVELSKVNARLLVVDTEETRLKFHERHGDKVYRYRRLLSSARRLEGLVKFGPVTSQTVKDQPSLFVVRVDRLLVNSDTKDVQPSTLITHQVVISEPASTFDSKVNEEIFSYCDGTPLNHDYWVRWERRVGYMLADHTTILEDILSRPVGETDNAAPIRKLTL